MTKIVTVGTTAADLKTLMETAGHVFPNNNDTCIGLIIQIDPASANTVDVMSEGETAGITLTTDSTAGPPSIAFKTSRIRNTYLVASASDTIVKVLVEQVGG